MTGTEQTQLQPLHLGHQRKPHFVHLLFVPILILIMYWYEWSSQAVIACSIMLAATVYWSLTRALNRHVTIDPIRRMVQIEWIQWGLISLDKRICPFSEFSAVRYHTYQHGIYDNPVEAQFGLYLVHEVADLWPCGDTGLDSSDEPKYDRDMAVAVARLMELPLLESNDAPWADQPTFISHPGPPRPG